MQKEMTAGPELDALIAEKLFGCGREQKVIDDLAKKIRESAATQDDIVFLIRSELSRAAGCELLAVNEGNLRCRDLCTLYHDIDLLLLQLAAARERIKELEQWKTLGCEYSSCLQKLCMDVLYKHCEPVSYGWPGKKHTDTIVEGVNFLLARIKELEFNLSARDAGKVNP